MFCIAYFSTGSKDLNEGSLQEILDASRFYNDANSVTGVLGYFDYSFFQVIEGERADVECLFNIIANDDRHHSVITVFESEVDSRSFTNWSMALVTTETLGPEREALCVYLETLKPQLECSHHSVVTMMINIFNKWVK